MAANGDIIKSFLVGLGFEVDESSLRIFNSEIAKAATRVTVLYTAVNAFASAIVYSFSKISEGFEEMGYQYHIIAPAINKAIVLRQELMKAYGAAGINIRKVIVDSVKLNMSLTKTKFAIEAIYKSVASKFFVLLAQQSDAFRKRLYENMPYIINALEKLVKVVFNAFKAVTILGGRVWSILTRIYDFFVMLDKATDGWSTVVLGLAAAWRLLNLSFIATPLGALITGFVALLALFDDFKTYQEGGKSLLNWGPAIPIINGVTQAVMGLVYAVRDLALLAGSIWEGDTLSSWDHIKNILHDIMDYANGVNQALDTLARKFGGEMINKVLDWRDSVDKSVSDWAGSRNWGLGGVVPKTPLGSNPSNQNNTNANMQTTINISGSPNASATARATAMEQQNVNRDFVRNLKGATR